MLQFLIVFSFRIAQQRFSTGDTLAQIDTLAQSDFLAQSDTLARCDTLARRHFSTECIFYI